MFGPEILVEQIVRHTKAAADHAIAEIGEESLFRTHANVAAAYSESFSRAVPLERIYRLLTIIADGNADNVERQATPEEARKILDLWSAYWQPATVKPAEKIRESAEIPG